MDNNHHISSKVTYIHTGDINDDKMGEMAALSITAASPAFATGLSRPVGIPPDHNHVARIIFLLLGVGVLTPWNAFITAADYFGHLYPDYHIDRVRCIVGSRSANPLLCMGMAFKLIAIVLGFAGDTRGLYVAESAFPLGITSVLVLPDSSL